MIDVNAKKFIPLRDVNLNNLVKDKTIFCGGHFLLDNDYFYELNSGTIESFRYAVELYNVGLEKGMKVGLGVLINNIGQTCNQTACSILQNFDKSQFKLPEEYEEILDEFGLFKKDVEIFWEKHIRNRGKKELIKHANKHPNIVQLEKDYWLSDSGSYGKIILTRGNASDKYGTPACPLIMGALAMEQEKEGYENSVSFYYIGNENQINIPNHFVIEKGSVVARRFGADIDVKNIFLMKKKT